MARVTQGISGLIGLATELHAHNKAKKTSPQENERQWSESRSTNEGQQSEAYAGPPPDYSFEAVGDIEGPSLDRGLFIQPLPYPVILPQRRPNSKSRGFVRAYAPDLGQYKGIDQQTFLAFLKEFHQSSQASPIFHVINIAAVGAGFAPSAIAMAVAAGVGAANRVAMDMHGRYRTNSYLDKVNEELFHPKKLHCMIMTFKPEAQQDMFLDFDVNRGFLSRSSSLPKMLNGIMNKSSSGPSGKFRTSDGIAQGEVAIPQAAQLIFPPSTSETSSTQPTDEDIDDSTPSQGYGTSSSSWKTTRKFVSDYHDRRAQAKFAGQNGESSKLVVPGASDSRQFASRFSDPNHPVNSGHPIALLTGGKITSPTDIKTKLTGLAGRQRGGSRLTDRISTEGDRIGGSRFGGEGRQGAGLLGGVKKMIQQDTLYLLIAEMPSQEDMEELELVGQ